jgi:hypothetical protein
MNLDVVGKKLADLPAKMEADKAPLELLGLFLRESAAGLLWDLVIASPRLKSDNGNSYEQVARQLRATLSDGELADISRIVILDRREGTALDSFLERYHNQTGPVDVDFIPEGGVILRRGYIVLARQLANSHPRTARKVRQRKADSRPPRPTPEEPSRRR